MCLFVLGGRMLIFDVLYINFGHNAHNVLCLSVKNIHSFIKLFWALFVFFYFFDLLHYKKTLKRWQQQRRQILLNLRGRPLTLWYQNVFNFGVFCTSQQIGWEDRLGNYLQYIMCQRDLEPGYCSQLKSTTNCKISRAYNVTQFDLKPWAVRVLYARTVFFLAKKSPRRSR